MANGAHISVIKQIHLTRCFSQHFPARNLHLVFHQHFNYRISKDVEMVQVNQFGAPFILYNHIIMINSFERWVDGDEIT